VEEKDKIGGRTFLYGLFCPRTKLLMVVYLNGERKDVRSGITISELLSELQIVSERVAVELNLNILEKSDFAGARLNEGDRLEIISFVGGGSQ
jgi:sulfur carrier protein